VEPAQPDLVVGRVVAVDDHPGARAPSYELTVDFGGRGTRSATVPLPDYDSEELLGRQVVCLLEGDSATLVGAHSHASGVVLVRPDREVEDGAPVA
jgi:tRNA-binding protein